MTACCSACAQVYEHLVFQGSHHRSLRTFPGMADRTVRVGSAGKTFSFTAWKVCLPQVIRACSCTCRPWGAGVAQQCEVGHGAPLHDVLSGPAARSAQSHWAWTV